MRYTFTAILAILALALGGVAWVHTGSEYRAKLFGTSATAEGENLFALEDLNRVRTIELSKRKGEKTVMHYDGRDWLAEQPWKDRADRRYINYLFQFATQLKVQSSMPRKGLELEKFGLRKGSTRVTMRDKSGEPIADFLIGRISALHVASDDGKVLRPTVFIRHVARGMKDHIYLCTSEDNATKNVHALFSDNFSRFRDHRPFLFSPLQLDSISLKNSNGEILLSRDKRRPSWRISKPIELRSNAKAVISLMNKLSALTAVKIDGRANVTLPTAGEAAQQAQEIALHYLDTDETVTLRVFPPVKAGDTTTLATISNRPNCVFHLPLQVGETSNVSLAQLQLGVDDLRSKTMAHLRPRQLKTLIVRPTGLPETIVTRTPITTWRVLREDGLEATNDTAVIRLLTAATQDHVTRFVTDAATDLRPYGLDKPSLRLAFVSFKGDVTGLAISRGSDGRIYAHEIGKPNIWEISNQTLGKIAIHAWQWRTGHVWHLPKVDIQEIAIERKGQPTNTLKYAFFSEKWTATREGKNATPELNPHRANLFLNRLEAISATAWLGPNHSRAVASILKPDLTVRVKVKQVDDNGLEKGSITKVLRIASTPGRLIHFAKVDTIPASSADEGEESYFLIDRETLRGLNVELFE